MATDFIRPTPEQMLFDTRQDAFENGREYDENKAREGVNLEFMVNGWASGPSLALVANPERFPASEARKQAIQRDDKAFVAEMEEARRNFDAEQLAKARAQTEEAMRADAAEAEIAKLREELAALRAEREAKSEDEGAAPPPPDTSLAVVPPTSAAASGGPVQGLALPDGVPTTGWTMAQLKEKAAQVGIALPNNGVGATKQSIVELILAKSDD